MESLTISAQLSLQDWQAFQRACVIRLRTQQSYKSVFGRFAFVCAVGLAVVWICSAVGKSLQPLSFIAGVLLVVASLWLNRRILLRSYTPRKGGTFFARSNYEFTVEGFRLTRIGLDAFVSWTYVNSISATPHHVFIWIDQMQAYVVPRRHLPEGMTCADLQRRLEEWVRVSALSNSSAEISPQAAATSTPAVALIEDQDSPGTASRPTAWLRLLALRPASGMRAIGSTSLICLLALVSLAVWVSVDWLNNQPDPVLYPYGAPGVGWYVLLQLAIAAVLARRSVPHADFRSTLVLVLLATPVAIITNFLLDSYLPWPWVLVAMAGAGIYFLVYAALGLKAITGKRQPFAVLGVLPIVLLFGWTTSQLYVDPSVWTVEEETEPDYTSTFDQAESLLFSQSARIDAAVDAIAPADSESPAAFFVGFAGVAEQRVFAEEIDLAAQVLGKRFDSTDRSLLLINDRRNLDAYPFASPTALNYALGRIAARMRLDRDILFLSLSSHGSSDGSLSVSNGEFMLHDLTATDLAASLRESGITWRVIIVSACYSGTFIEPLRDANTIVITASAADRTSFGCSDDRDLTYFGEAFYRDALPGAATLRDAFEAARADIAAREYREHIKESKPQAFFGAEIEKYIKSADVRQLRAAPGPHRDAPTVR